MTYRWYKIMSPSIDLTVQSVGKQAISLCVSLKRKEGAVLTCRQHSTRPTSSST